MRRSRLLGLAVALPMLLAATSGAAEGAPTCIQVASQARYVGLGYDHIVTVRNGCDRTVVCDVSTNVNPTPTRVTIPPQQGIEVITFKGSPARVFTPNVQCEFEE